MFEIGDLVTVDSEALKLHVHRNVFDQWKTCEIGIVTMIEGYKGGATVLVKVHFQSLGSAYWLYAHEVIHINSQILDKK